MAINYTVLKTEINGTITPSSPNASLYVTPFANGDDNTLAAILNSLTDPGAASVHRNDVQPGELIDAIANTDWDVLTTLQYQQLSLLSSMRFIDCTRDNLRANAVRIFPAGVTKTAFQTVVNRTGSRAEVLFGTGTVITSADIARARVS